MKIRELLRLLLWPLIAACVVLVGFTFLTYFLEGRSAVLDYFLGIIDLREERTFGTWFESILFILTGLSFFLISFHPKLALPARGLLFCMALGFCFLSADEALSLHEFMGYEFEQATGVVDNTALDQRGYSWVLLYAPVALILFGLIIGLYRRMLKPMSSPGGAVSLGLAWVMVFLVILMETLEGWSVLARFDGMAISTCFEELFELAALMLFYNTNLLIAEDADL